MPIKIDNVANVDVTTGGGGTPVTGGTVGSVLFVGTGSTLAQDNANFFWDDANNRLGIGTAAPGYGLDVQNNNSITANFQRTTGSGNRASVQIQNSSYGVSIDVDASGMYFRDQSHSADRMTIDATGLIGINTIAPKTFLHVHTATNRNWMIRDGGATYGSELLAANDALGAYAIGSINASTLLLNSPLGGSGNVGIGNSAPLSTLGLTGNASIGATYGVIAAPTSGLIVEGNVGIGTTSVSETLHLKSETSANIAFEDTTDGVAGYIGPAKNNQSSASTDYLGLRGESGVSLSVGTSIKAALDSSGNFGIGVTPTRILSLRSGSSTALAQSGGTIFNSFTDTSTTSTDGTEDDLYSYSIAANTLATNGDGVFEREHVQFVASATAARRLKKYFGGSLVFDSGALTLTLGGDFTIETMVIRESSTVVRVSVNVVTTSASSIPYATYTRITSLTLTNAQVLKTTGIASGTGAASGDIVNNMARVTWESAA